MHHKSARSVLSYSTLNVREPSSLDLRRVLALSSNRPHAVQPCHFEKGRVSLAHELEHVLTRQETSPTIITLAPATVHQTLLSLFRVPSLARPLTDVNYTW